MNRPNRRSKDRVRYPENQVPAELRISASDQLFKANVFINDVSPSGMGIYVESMLEVGSLVILTLKIPKPMALAGQVMWCSRFDVHSAKDDESNRYTYRAGVKFNNEAAADLEELKNHCLSLQK